MLTSRFRIDFHAPCSAAALGVLVDTKIANCYNRAVHLNAAESRFWLLRKSLYYNKLYKATGVFSVDDCAAFGLFTVFLFMMRFPCS